MSLIAVCADKGSPGVTTTALALAAAWPRPVVAAELDPSGGDLGLRMVDRTGRLLLRSAPGLLTWAAAAGLRSGRIASLWEHCQAAGGVQVLVGAAGAEQASGLGPLWRQLASALRVTDGDVLADLGRLMPDSPVLPVAAAADLVLVVTTGSVEGLVHTRDRVRALARVCTGRLGVVAVASDRRAPWALEALRTVLDRDGLPAWVAGFLAVDADGVTGVYAGDRSAWQRRTLLARTAGQVVSVLADWLQTSAEPGGGHEPTAPHAVLAVPR